MTTRADLEIDLDPPKGARPMAIAVIEAVEEGIQAQVLTLATGKSEYDVDLVGWLTNQGLLSAEGLDADAGESVMVDRHTDTREKIEVKTANLQDQHNAVNDSAVEAFKTTNGTFQEIKKKVRTLQENLSQYPGPGEGEQFMPIDSEYAAIGAALNTLSEVIDLVDTAQRDMEGYAGEVERNNPGNSGNPTQIWGTTSPQSNMTFTVTGDATRKSILEAARAELALGAAERGSSNSLYYAEKPGVKVPYDIGDAWCAAFTSHVWKQAGYEVDWTNPNYVPAIWNDAKAKLDTATAAYAEEGDLIIFDWQGDGTPDHIGIVERVEGNTIHTIEGNSSDQLKRNQYQMGNNDLVGVVKPPAQQAPAQQPVPQ
ncbi:CHAP domain-containing protein [Nocardia flavorosea]|uniref:CHAP domain-containing protein n=1 Tax=Nocardia flavorosea TaxID=53429 RepID=UPI001895E289|nr:CHAP domain-containing protein [Nocardia flavorosea]MBF6352484.1 CHAP domain-containing protein [Nocardia flavorosea]